MAKRRGNNEGSITKRKDGRWQGYVIVGYNIATGKPKKKYFYSNLRKEVQRKIEDTREKVKTQTYRDTTKITVAEWFTTWLHDYMKTSLRKTTWDSYRYQVDGHIVPNLGHLRLIELQTNHLQRLYNEKLISGRLDNRDGGLSPKSVRYIHTVIHSCLEQARKENKIIINPASAVKLPKYVKPEIGYMNTDEIRQFLAYAKESKFFTAFYLALTTGMRRGEILAIRWQDVDLVNNKVSVNQSLVRVKEGGLIFQEPKTKLAKRTINISKHLSELLHEQKEKQSDFIKVEGDNYKSELNLVFCNNLGEPICPRNFTRQFERLIIKAGVKKIPFHAVRHTFATICLQEKVDIKTIQENLGHHSSSFTMDVYSSVTDKMKRDASDKVDTLIDSLMPED